MQATILYCNENNNILPFDGWNDPLTPNWCYDNGNVTYIQSDVQNGQLWPKLGDYRCYRCPQENPENDPVGTVNVLTSYVMNGSSTDFNNNNSNCGLKITQFHPDDVLYWEVQASALGTGDANDATQHPTEGLSARHNTGTTVGYMDGHADVMMFVEFNAECQYGPSPLWCDPLRSDGGFGLYTPVNPVPVQYQ